MSAWNADDSFDFRGPLDVTRAATAVLDVRGVIIGWSPAAEDLLGYPAHEVVGRQVEMLVVHPPGPGGATPTDWLLEQMVRNEGLELRHRDGHLLQAATTICSLSDGTSGSAWVLVAADLKELHGWQSRQAMLRGLATQSPIGLAIYDTDLRLAWANAASRQELPGPLTNYLGTPADELYPRGAVLSKEHPASLEQVMRQVLATGEPIIDLHYRGRPPADLEHDHVWSCAYYRLDDAQGHSLGVCEDAYDITERYRTEQRLALLVRAGARIGATLDVASTAGEVAEVCVPEFADAVHVDVDQAVMEGDEPGPVPGRPLIRVAGHALSETVEPVSPQDALPRPDDMIAYPPASPQGRCLTSGLTTLDAATEGGPARLIVALRSRSATIGLVTFVRDFDPTPFDEEDVELAQDLVARTAVCVDNARRYNRERNAALTLQRNLLPQRLPPQTAVEVAHRYLPADNVAGVGGDWFDVIPLSGARVALVIGDVVGHGLRAAATMGRLRATVRALARLDFTPDELLSRLDDLVGQAAQEEADARAADHHARAERPNEDEDFGVTCVYAVYDPISGRCSIARAGHLPPAVVEPEGGLVFPDVPPGPPLGLGGLPFENVEIELPEGTLIALFTDGLVEVRGQDIDIGIERLGRALVEDRGSLEELCDRTVAALLPSGPATDDAALLLVRTRVLSDRQVAVWELPATAAAVARARSSATRQLDEWGLAELSFTTELVVSELVTNTIRHAEGPIQLRLIRDRTLLCEVSDTGHTSPHLRHAASDDEGGRGLFIVAQLVQKWGTRYTPTGKTIWTEQTLSGH